MTTIQAQVPDYLARLAAEVAAREKATVDQIIALALSAQIEAWKVRDDVATRARRGQSRGLGRSAGEGAGRAADAGR